MTEPLYQRAGVKWRAVWLPLAGALLMLAAFACFANAATSPNPYRTDAQAERYLAKTRGGVWYCLNGYYSRREQRLKRHPRGYMRHNAEERFLSFTCVGDGPALYLLTRPAPRPWVVVIDR